VRPYAILQAFLRLLVRCFFREVHVVGAENLPLDRGGVLVSWHPNGLVDPGLILTSFPRPVVFGARHGLFMWPLLGSLLRALGTVPIYRREDQHGRDRATDNAKSLDALASRVADGSYSALFPEGISHDMPHLAELKTGAARLYYSARTKMEPGANCPAIVPVGLHYDAKKIFRSRALVWYHPPIELTAELDVTPADDEDLELGKTRSKALTNEIERVLTDVVHATDDWRLHHAMHRTRKLIRAERAKRAGARSHKPDVADKTVGFARVRQAYYQRLATHPEEVAALRARVEAYDDEMRALGIEDHQLDQDPRLASPWLGIILLLQLVFVFLLLPPLLLVGYAINGPTALIVLALSKLGANKKKDVATIKMLAGAILFPLTWMGAAVLGFMLHVELHRHFPSIPDHPILAGALLAILAAAGGILSLRYLHLAQETLAAVRVRLTKARRKVSIARLSVERAELYERLSAMAEGIELPGKLEADGSLRLS
jgi:glycerol-3-phosphate O-acyltransferase / dihydroxyacetone phosphate acyltransferase